MLRNFAPILLIGLRDYGVDGQMGLEETPQAFVAALVAVFEEVRRVLKPDGVCWVNLGDSYNTKQKSNIGSLMDCPTFVGGLKPKDLIGIPWRVAFALQEAGWWLRQDVIWNKPNPMPESVTDRCTKSHEYIFLLTKSARYYYDNEAIKEPIKDVSVQRLLAGPVLFGGQNPCPDTRLQSGNSWTPKKWKTPDGWDTTKGEGGHGSFHKNGREKGQTDYANRDRSMPRNRNGITGTLDVKGYAHRGTGDQKLTGHSDNFDANGDLIGDGYANKRSVWTVTTKGFKDAHFATFPEKLIEPMILAGSRVGDTVLDPFNGAGTTGLVSLKHGRNYLGIEINQDYIDISNRRLAEIQVKLF